MSFSCHMYKDKEVLDALFLYLKERLWLWILCFMAPFTKNGFGVK